MSESDRKPIELLLENLLNVISKLEKEFTNLDDGTKREFEKIKLDIEVLKEATKHNEMLEVLSDNVSVQGFKSLINDVKDNTRYRETQIAAKEMRDKIVGILIKFIVPGIMFLSGIAWVIIQKVLGG